jgi:Tol biopolymer transport system component
VKRSTSLVLLALACTAALPLGAAQAESSPAVGHGRAVKAVAASSPPNVVFSTGNEVRQLDLSTGNTVAVASTTADAQLTAAAWSAATKRIYYANSVETADGVTSEVDSVPEGGGAPTTDVPGASELDISADGLTTVFTKDDQLYKSVGGTVTRLTGAGGFNPRLSPKGDRIVFTRITGQKPGGNVGNSDVYTLGIDGTGLKRITGSAVQDEAGTFSPDGKRLLFSRAGLNGTQTDPSVYSVGTDGTGLRLVARDAYDPDWSANGWITYLALDDSNLFQVAVRSPGVPGTETIVTSNGFDTEAVRFRSGNEAGTPAG